MKALLVIPFFNEGVKLESTCARVKTALALRGPEKVPVEVIIMDDGSTDQSGASLAQTFGFLYARNERRAGVGYSIHRAYEIGLERGCDILLTMAGNNKDNPEEIDRLIDPIAAGEADFVQGSRYLPGGNFGNMPAYRLVTTRIVHPLLFSLISGARITDSTNGFRAVRREVLRDPRMNLRQEWLTQYELEPYLFYYAVRLGYRVREVPVTKIYPDAKLGYSKMKPITGWWSILRPLVYLGLGIKR